MAEKKKKHSLAKEKSSEELLEEVEDLRKEISAIENSLKWHEEILRGLSTASLVIDVDHRIVEWNHACENLTGVGREKIIGTKNAWKCFYKKKRPLLADLIVDGRIGEIGEFYDSFEKSKYVHGGYSAKKWITINRKTIYICFTSSPIHGIDGKIVGAVETFEDITEIKRAEEAMTELAIRDSLTGLFNRRRLLELLSSEFERAVRYGSAMTVCMMDFDRFKNVNDLHGHDVGDKVLSRSAKVISRELRKIDFCGRYGGEEFCIILPNTKINDARTFLERLRKKIGGVSYTSSKGEKFNVTCSIGAAEYSHEVKDAEQLLRLADQAMYSAKGRGRNRVCVYKDGGFV